jgi:putative transposase
MPHTYAQNYLHIVFSTKERKKLIVKEFQPKLWSYMAGIGRNNGFFVIANGGMEDHAHLLIHLPASLALAKAVQLLKGSSSRWINEHGDEFSWQEGYGAFSMSASNLDTVKRYIANQESHHRKVTFEQEFIAFLKKHKIDYDPRYVFN